MQKGALSHARAGKGDGWVDNTPMHWDTELYMYIYLLAYSHTRQKFCRCEIVQFTRPVRRGVAAVPQSLP